MRERDDITAKQYSGTLRMDMILRMVWEGTAIVMELIQPSTETSGQVSYDRMRLAAEVLERIGKCFEMLAGTATVMIDEDDEDGAD